MLDVIPHKGGNEVIRVIVTGPHSQINPDSIISGGGTGKILRLQLILQEIVRGSLID